MYILHVLINSLTLVLIAHRSNTMLANILIGIEKHNKNQLPYYNASMTILI